MTDPRKISINDYSYQLPDEKIALHPLTRRDASRLLIYRKGELEENTYSNIDKYIPPNSLLVFNDTKVINARLRFKKATGATIEIFCLEPSEAINDYASIMIMKGHVRWKCLVGGIGKWKNETLEKKIIKAGQEIILSATLIERSSEAHIIEFNWKPESISFAEILELAGDIPLPPYIKRETNVEDKDRYQTIYAHIEGSVAAPTAGLHFTDTIFKKLKDKNISTAYVTLHVGAGTFKPVKAELMQDHEMHAEWIDVGINTILAIVSKISHVIAVGTTSLRTLETLYWLGLKIHIDPAIKEPDLQQWDVYDKKFQPGIPAAVALEALVNWMKSNNTERIFCKTQLLIVPGYQFKIASALVTNFHQPHSTLLLLVAAAAGNDWKKIYDYALNNQFRFLSYGDGNLIFINDQG